MPQHLMILPSLACPASCKYCFGPHKGGPSMGREMVEAVARWQNTIGSNNPLDITFHGGEPLVLGADFYRMALPLLRQELAPRQVSFSLQSNLWLLTDELCELFREYRVSLSTSLDGPETINDAQRGQGYFRRTMTGIERSRAHGMEVGCICTFTHQSAVRAQEVFDFFTREELRFSIHAALPALGHTNNGWVLTPEAHGQLLIEMLERYLANLDKVRISTLDAMCRSVSAGHGGICTFGDCLGAYLAVDPQGWIYACQRLAGMPEYRLGNVLDCPSLEMLAAAPAWRMFQERQENIEQECGGCPHLIYCRGGCPYNALTSNNGKLDHSFRDPHCPAYKRVFDHITNQALEEVFSEQNLSVIVEDGPGKYGLMQKGRLLQLMRGGPHPQTVIRRSRELVAAVALAVSESPIEALHKLYRAGLVTQPERALGSLKSLRNRLDTQSQQELVNAYLHVTYACNLTCNHCYANAGPIEKPSMPVADILRLVLEAAEAGFRKVVITGGEPLVLPQREELLDALAGIRQQVKPTQSVLRTNLAYPLTSDLVEKLAHSTDQVVVSLDGDETSHDARRGVGIYAYTVANLKELLKANPTTKVSITAVLTNEQMEGPEAEAVTSLGDKLGIRVRLKSVLPLGRGAELGLQPAYYNSLDDIHEKLSYGTPFTATCGLGMNLYIGPDGTCYPCYALMSKRHMLGNAIDEGLMAVLERNKAYQQVTVDSNLRCRSCVLRYVCGGFCRAWSVDGDPNASPVDCNALHSRALKLLGGAIDVLNVPLSSWTVAGLPLPEIIHRTIELKQ
jgi:uncharacterized protein